MSRFMSDKFAALTPYTPGEQPRERKYVKLNTNESPFPPSPIAQRLARQAAGDLQLYSDPTCRDLVAAGAEFYGVSPDELLFFNGSDDAIGFAFNAFCDDKTPALFPDITYSFYPVAADFNRVPYETKPLNADFTLNVADYCGAGKTIFLANPNAPTGIALSLSEIEQIVSSNPDNVVVVDEAYVDFGAESAVCLTKKYDNLLVCQTLSKSRSLAGGRLGVAIGNKALIADLNTLKYSTNPYNVNRMTSAAGIGAFCDVEYFEKNCRTIMENRAWTEAQLKALGFVMTDSKANFLFAKHPQMGGLDLYNALREQGVLVRHFETELLRDYNRITVGSKEEMETLVSALKTILGVAK